MICALGTGVQTCALPIYIIGLPADDAVLASAKTGIGIDEILEAIVHRIPPPRCAPNAPLKAMLVDSWYDPYLGVVILVRVIDGALKKGQQVKFMQAGTIHLKIGRASCRESVCQYV